MSLFKLLASVLTRIYTAITSPFRMLLIQAQRLFNIQIITAKLIQPLTKNVRKLLRLKPTEKSDYISVGRFLIFKQLLALLILAACAGVFIYFNIYATKVAAPPVTLQMVKTDVSFRYDDINVKAFSGTANILSFDNQIIYTGEIVSGVCQGQGMLFSRGGQLIYEGGFQNNRYQGYGVKYNPEGKTEYEGEFQDNLYNGAGKLFNARGTLIYDGMFKKGEYDGDGKLYSDRGRLLYEGQFAANQRHGTGIEYYEDGTTHYKGEFFQDAFQGRGELFGASGKLFYTGAMYGGKINYRSLVGATLQDVETSFADTPLIYYEEDGSVCFFYEKTGVVISTDCRIKVYETEREKDDPSEGLFYLPGEEGYYLPQSGDEAVAYDGESESRDSDTNLSASSQPESSQPSSADQPDPLSQNDPELPEDFSLLRASKPSLRQLDRSAASPEIKPMAWVIIDPYSSSSSSGSESSSSSSSSQSESDASQSQSSESSIAESASSTRDELYGMPDFIEKTKELYFEVDTDVWQPEYTIGNTPGVDKTKIFIRRVTVIGQDPPATEGFTEIEDDSAPSVEDCVAIETIRRKSPTAFHDISFQLDGQNKLFHRVWNINHANRITRKTYLSGELTVRYCYEPDDESVPAYYSIES